MNDPNQDQLLFDAGQIVGMLIRYQASDYRLASMDPKLTRIYQDILLLLAELRDTLEMRGIP